MYSLDIKKQIIYMDIKKIYKDRSHWKIDRETGRKGIGRFKDIENSSTTFITT